MNTNRIPESPPLIEPLTGKGERPLWSVMVPAYNCSHYLRATLESILIQDAGIDAMQIEVIDDCSTDEDVAFLVREIGKGRISYFRQQENVGSLRNFETCLKRARGKWIHLLHGDDLVKHGFYVEVENLFRKYPFAGAAFTGFSGIDEEGLELYSNNLIQNEAGIIEDWLVKISEQQRLQACAIVVKRSVYEELGGFFGVHYGEDWEMWARIAANFPVAYSPENLAAYRHHNNNISARFTSTGQNIKDIKKVIGIIQTYLPVEKRKKIRTISKRFFANYFSINAHGIYRKHRNARAALIQAKGALLLHANKTTIISLLKIYVKVLIKYKRID
ncbi:MAG: glycosyltransferase [Ferruginibacter sp.]|nr:glycosyltransferase [Ferruginibacter sp.]